MLHTRSNPLISIIIVTFNAIEHIEGCLTCILNQEFKDYELIVIDAISQDGTIEVLKKYKTEINSLIIEKDKGIYDAMNKGVTLARGRFLYFIGADDRLLDSFSYAVTFLKDDNTIYYGDVILGTTGKTYGGQFKTKELVKRNICHQAIFYPNKSFRKYQYQLKYRMLADYELNIKLWSDADFKFEYIPVCVATYANVGESTKMEDKRFFWNSFRLVFVHFGFPYFLYKLFNGTKKRVVRNLHEKD